jgi:hypothetical protein
MADLARVPQSEIHLIWQEIQAHSSLIMKHHVDQRAELDLMKLRWATLMDLLEELLPGFQAKYALLYSQELQTFNPESEESSTS